MNAILQISDLHLAPPGQDAPTGDYKARLVPAAQRQRRLAYLKQTLNALPRYLSERGLHLDAVVITGDVTYQGEAYGFNQLAPVLSSLGDVLPPPDRIVVVPGNHDVALGSPPGSHARYAAFVDGIRSQGYTTPLLDGVDYDGEQPRQLAAGPLLVGDTYLIAAMNSADYAVSREPLSAEAARELQQLLEAGTMKRALSDEIERLRRYDAARINSSQLQALSHLIGSADPLHDRVRIVALHHHLFPVSADEEVKPFENLINLGELRTFLADNCVDVVLHGHKHRSRVAQDVFAPYGEASDDRLSDHHTLVVGVGTVGGQSGAGAEIARLFVIDPSFTTFHPTTVTSLRAVAAGGAIRVRPTDMSTHALSRAPRDLTLQTIFGKTASETYEQLDYLLRSGTDVAMRPIACVVDDGATASSVPSKYPYDPPDHDVAGWFRRTVAWWQSRPYLEGARFTHGQFIRAWRGSSDQIQGAVRALTNDPRTSRAVVTLLDPPSNLEDKSAAFPAFCMAHFYLHAGRLDVVAMYRKQEMRYWWPINIAEIAEMQKEVVDGLREAGSSVVAGRITTLTSNPVAGDSLPKVSVPRIEQMAWTERLGLYAKALALVDGAMPGRAVELAALVALVQELYPPEHMPPDGPAEWSHGIAVVVESAESLLKHYQGSQATTSAMGLLRRLGDLSDRILQRRQADGPDRYTRWRDDVRHAIDELNTLLSSWSRD